MATQTFRCDICEKNYKSKSILNQHIKKYHSGADLSATCDICGKTYANKYILKTHINNIHNNNKEQTEEEEQHEEQQPERKHWKYDTEEERHNAILKSKRNFYHRNEEIYKLKSLMRYYVKQLERTDLTEKKRRDYQAKFKELDKEFKKLTMKPIEVIEIEDQSRELTPEELEELKI